MSRDWMVMLKDGSLLTFGTSNKTDHENAKLWARLLHGAVIGPKGNK